MEIARVSCALASVLPFEMVEVKERRSSGRLVGKRIILSEDEEVDARVDKENYNCSNSERRSSRRNQSGSASFLADGDEEDEEFIPPPSSSRRPVPDESESEYSEESECGDSAKKRRRDRVEELRERRSSSRARKLRESDKLISEFPEINDPTESKRRKNKMEEEDAALAAAISAGYFSDEERELEHVRLKNGTRFKDRINTPTCTNTTPTYNPYARNGLGAYSGPMRRSGRTAAVVSAARVAMYSSILNPDSSVHAAADDAEPTKYNLRPNRPGAGGHSEDAMAAYYEHSTIDTSMNNLERLFEEDDVDGNQSNSNEIGGEVSLTALDKIAGMDGYVRKLKEMIVFPLIYPQLFSKLNISLPRGVLFHGPPGTGKTLMARLLASACSTSERKVSFFMRNGSDCLSKWIGEAERNMRLLFKKAKDCQPSIIFFDEIDGLAPERTGRQDQSHISLVSTLLALMDGLDDRGQVIVIGATNRIHSIDAALRRPGRFDREFYFGLPDEAARAKILEIHTCTWDPPIDATLAKDLANRTSGYSGADMKALCVEAALRAVQRTFPQVYESSATAEPVTLEGGDVRVGAGDFEHALLNLTPSNRRHVSQYDLVSLQKPQIYLYESQLSDLRARVIDPLLKKSILMDASGKSTWQVLEPLVIKIEYDAPVHPESFVWRFVCGLGDRLDGFALHPVDLLTLCDEACGLESTLWRGLIDAKMKGGAFAVLFKGFPGLRKAAKKIFVKTMKRFCGTLIPGEPIILIFTSCHSVKRAGKSSTVPGSFFKTFELCPPCAGQLQDYFNFTLRSIHRLFAAEMKEICPEEEEFVGRFRRDRVPVQTIRELERWRLEIGDRVRRNPLGFLDEYFEGLLPEPKGYEDSDLAECYASKEQMQSHEVPEDVLF